MEWSNPLANLGILFAVALLAAAVGCATPAATPVPFSREQAIARATQDAKQSVPEVGILQARIDTVSAELITLGEADARVGGGRGPAGYAPGQTAQSPVWWVVVRGYFQYQGMQAPSNPAPTYEADERDFIFDALTGEEIGGQIPNTRPASAPTRAPVPAALADYPLKQGNSWTYLVGSYDGPNTRELASSMYVFTDTVVMEDWFCPGVGYVDLKSDHHGTPFGDRRVLIGYHLAP